MALARDENPSLVTLDSLSQIMAELDELSSEIQRLIQNIHLLLMKKVEFGDTLAQILIALAYFVERIEQDMAKVRRFMFEFIRTLYRVLTVMHRNLIAEHISLTSVMNDIDEETNGLTEAKILDIENSKLNENTSSS